MISYTKISKSADKTSAQIMVPNTKIIAVVKSWDIPMCNLLAKCREIISLVDFLLYVFYIVRKPGKSVTSYLLMNINELMLLL